ncbi:MAG TPA: DUF433 domain-containing protein [Thermoanaerobaculia bacterium]|nr:DUF433 domain-containing protein [Thermoanaerobaculia bacterium]
MILPLEHDPLPLKEDKDGTVRVGGTRVTLETVVQAFKRGASAEEIVEKYPSLQLADVYAVIGHYLRHRGEVEDYLRKQESETEEVWQQIEAKFDPQGIRERLLARKHPA